MELAQEDRYKKGSEAVSEIGASLFNNAESLKIIERLNHEIEVLKFKLERESRFKPRYTQEMLQMKFTEHLNSDSFLKGTGIAVLN